MPPHCDTMDGPVVSAARKALEAEDVNFALAYVPESGEAEVRSAFEKVLRACKADQAAREVADLYFFETVVRVHRAGEGAPYTGLRRLMAQHGRFVSRWPHAGAAVPGRPASSRSSCDRSRWSLRPGAELL
jgi:Family of unknown function (DUF6448)